MNKNIQDWIIETMWAVQFIQYFSSYIFLFETPA